MSVIVQEALLDAVLSAAGACALSPHVPGAMAVMLCVGVVFLIVYGWCCFRAMLRSDLPRADAYQA